MPTIQETYELAVRRHNAGELVEAEQLFRRILLRDPNHADALHRLGVISLARKRYNVAIELIGKAIAVAPNRPSYHSNLGNALKDQGELEKAIASFQAAIKLKPDFAEAHYNLGMALNAQGNFEEAASAFRAAIRIKPGHADFHNSLGISLKDLRQLDEAAASFRQAIQLKPDFAAAHSNLGNVLNAQDKLDDAIAAHRIAIGVDPAYAEAHNNLGIALKEKGEMDEAISSYRAAIKTNPSYAEAHNNLGVVLAERGQLDDAIQSYRTAIQLKPDYGEGYTNLGNALKDQGRMDEAIDAVRTAIKLQPDISHTHSALIFDLHYHPNYDSAAIASEVRLWYERHAEPLKKSIPVHSNHPEPSRRIRIGYVSPDFRRHPVGRFMLPLLEHHDHAAVEVFCYSDVLRGDELTAHLRHHASIWRNTFDLSDEQLAETVRQDEIDILVDLTMHTANNRLLVFARKPAPIQVSWLAYAGATGLETIDYRLTDQYMDALGVGDDRDWEKPLRLPRSYWCYPPPTRAPDVNALPALSRGHITFGCLNNFAKVNAPTLSMWCTLLRKIPDSRLLLHTKEGSHRVELQELFAKEQVDPARVEFIPRLAALEYFQCYQRIDIALDTHPFGGGTTTCDALWMGVPVITLSGQTPLSRVGLSILSNVGLPELVAATPGEYVGIAAELANDLPRLTMMRQRMRERMQQSPLMDGASFARDMEEAYRKMWRTWCDLRGR